MSLGLYLFIPFALMALVAILTDAVPPLWNEWQYRREKDAFHRAAMIKTWKETDNGKLDRWSDEEQGRAAP